MNMSQNNMSYQAAIRDFNDARRKASLHETLAWLSGKSAELLSYNDVAQKLKLRGGEDRGVQDISLDAIVGSVGRYTDFTRAFLPRSPSDQERWAKVKEIMRDPTSRKGMKPIEVYKVGEAYFVSDGNHRVSIARYEGRELIKAQVIEINTEVPLTPDLQPDDLIIKAEYAEFLRITDIKNLFPNVDLSVTIPGQYEKLLNHIEIHRYFMDLNLQRDIPYKEAVQSWYETTYTTFIEPIRERGIMRWFPDRTETDLYLWVIEHQATLKKELGWFLSPEAVITDLSSKSNLKSMQEESEPGHWRQTKIYDRYTEHLFREILVPFDGDDEDFVALEQAIVIAQKEQAMLNGLQVIHPKSKVDTPEANTIKDHFEQRCQEAGIEGGLAVVQGKTADLINSYSLLTDLIVLNLSQPPESGLSGLNSDIRSIIWRSSRPIVTVPNRVSPLDNALLAFDGSVKSKEALFVATYIAERWHTRLTVLTLSEKNDTQSSIQDHARAYLDLHEIQANYVLTKGTMDTFLDVSQERDINLVLMGGYSGTILKEMVVGSLVSHLLREFNYPLLICR